MGYLPPNWAEATRLWSQVIQIGVESQMVISVRIAQIMGILPQPKGESQRMVQEKLDAAQEAGSAIMHAVSRGARADQVMAAALKPYGRRTRINARRLSRAAAKSTLS